MAPSLNAVPDFVVDDKDLHGIFQQLVEDQSRDNTVVLSHGARHQPTDDRITCGVGIKRQLY